MPSEKPEVTQTAIAKSSMTVGMTNASITAFAPTDGAAITVISCPTAYRLVSAHFTSMIFSLLSAELQYEATLQLLQALL
jgi:hypothetical protein